MHKINPLLDQASKKLKKDSSRLPTEVGRSNKALDSSDLRVSERGMDHVDAINQVFAEFEFAYHNQFHKAFADLESLTIAKKYWLSNVEEYSPSHIVAAGKKLIKSREYLPTIAAFLMECEKGYELFGLPSVRAAYAEVCGASSPKASHDWSHEAVYLAGKATGWFLLANEPERTTFPLFEFNYMQVVKKVMTGQDLMVTPPVALKERVSNPTSKGLTKERLAKLRSELGL
jgi:hypothetical protein